MTRKFVVWRHMQNEWGSCSWAVLDADTYPFVMVKTPFGQKATQLGGHAPDVLARILMKEINSQACADGC
jgi:hypothetical protein